MTAEQAVVEQFERAFPVEPRPADDRLALHECAECDGVRVFLRGVRWMDLPDAVVDENYDDLPLLTPEAFVYYVPAYMRRAVREPRVAGLGVGMVLAFTIYALCDVDIPRSDFWRERVERFTPEQGRAIVTFLRWAATADAGVGDLDAERARRGLTDYWDARVRENP